ELRHQNKIDHIKFPIAAQALKKIDLLNEIQQPRHIHQPEERCRNRYNSRCIAARKKLPETQAQDKENKKTGLEIIHARRRTLRPNMAGQLQKRPHHQQSAAENPPTAETN